MRSVSHEVEAARRSRATERQQWDGANNAVALEPGVVFTYDRNTQTNAALRTPASRSSRSWAPSSAAAAAEGTA